MATTYNHVQMHVVDASGNVNVIYPITYAKDVTVETNSNTYLVNNSLTTAQKFVEKAGTDIQAMKDIICASNAAAHNAVYRGVDLAKRSWCGANSDGTISTTGLTTLCSRISSGSFEDIYIGDYFAIAITTSVPSVDSSGNITYTSVSETVYCVIADLDTYYNNGDTALAKHHATIVPMYCFKTTNKMNYSNTTGTMYNSLGAYAGSFMRTYVLPAYSTAIKNVLGDHLVSKRMFLSNAMNSNTPSAGYSAWSGASSGWAWYDSTLELLSEPEAIGSSDFGDIYDVGNAKTQLNYFRHNPAALVTGLGSAGRSDWWLRAVADSGDFALVSYNGHVGYYASYSFGVRPAYLIS